MGESNRDKGLNNAANLQRIFLDKLDKVNFDAGNALKDYKDEFSYGDMSRILDKQNFQDENMLNAQYNNALTNQNRAIGQRAAASGMANGSLLNSLYSNTANDIGENKFNALQNILSNNTKQQIGLMDQANANKFRNTTAYQGQENFNIENLLRKYGLLSSGIGQQFNIANQMDDTTAFDDALGVINTGANIYSAFKKK